MVIEIILAILFALSLAVNIAGGFILREKNYDLLALRAGQKVVPRSGPLPGQHDECGGFWGPWKTAKYPKAVELVMAMKNVREEQYRECESCNMREVRYVG